MLYNWQRVAIFNFSPPTFKSVAISIKKTVFILDSFTFLLIFINLYMILEVFLQQALIIMHISLHFLTFFNFQAFMLYASLFQQHFSRNCHVYAHIMKITIEFSSCNTDCDCNCDAMIAVMAYGYKQCIYRGKL